MALFLGGSHVSPAFGDAISVNVHNQSKTITPTKSVQTLVPDPGYTGMSQVTVESIPSSYVIPSGTLNISSNSVYNVNNYANVNVNVDVSLPEGAIIPSGTYTVSSAGSNIDIKQYASLNVSSGDFSITYGLQSSSAQVSIDVRTNPVGWINKQAAHTVYLPSTSVSHVIPTLSSQTIIPQYRWTLNNVIVDAIPDSYVVPSGTYKVSSAGTFDIKNYASLSVPSSPLADTFQWFSETEGALNYTISVYSGYVSSTYTTGGGYYLNTTSINNVMPTTESQTIISRYTYTLDDVVVNAIPSSYTIPSGTYTVSNSGSFDIKNYANLNVPSGSINVSSTFTMSSGRITYAISNSTGWLSETTRTINTMLPMTSISIITPSTASQVAVPQYNWTLNSVVVSAMSLKNETLQPSAVSRKVNDDYTIAGFLNVNSQADELETMIEMYLDNSISNEEFMTYSYARINGDIIVSDYYNTNQGEYHFNNVIVPIEITDSSSSYKMVDAIFYNSSVTPSGLTFNDSNGVVTSIDIGADTYNGPSFYISSSSDEFNYNIQNLRIDVSNNISFSTNNYQGWDKEVEIPTDQLLQLLQNQLSVFSYSQPLTFLSPVFCHNDAIQTVNFLNLYNIGERAFYNCYNLTIASFLNTTNVGNSAFAYCSALTTASFPKVTSIGTYAFYNCSALTTANFPSATIIGSYAFTGCSKLSALYLTGTSIVKLSANAFTNTPMSNSTYLGYFGSIYVPTSLLASYKTSTYWSVYSSRFVGV